MNKLNDLLLFAAIYVTRNSFKEGDILTEIVCPVFALWNILVSVLVGGLLTFHILLLFWGITTNEFYRKRKRNGSTSDPIGSEDDKFRNCFGVFCATVRESELPDLTGYPGMDDESRDVEAASIALEALQKALVPLSNNVV